MNGRMTHFRKSLKSLLVERVFKTDLQKGPQPLQLYNLEDDITERNNVSDDNPMIVEKIESILLNARTTPALEKFKIKAID